VGLIGWVGGCEGEGGGGGEVCVGGGGEPEGAPTVLFVHNCLCHPALQVPVGVRNGACHCIS
jgi:hypothetical protein